MSMQSICSTNKEVIYVVKRNISWKVVVSFACRNMLYFTIYGCLVTFLYHNSGHRGISLGIFVLL